jgi:hypothetical protein
MFLIYWSKYVPIDNVEDEDVLAPSESFAVVAFD